jgi:hypothetical protein
MLCADWLGLSLGPVSVGRLSALTEPPVAGVVESCGDSGAIRGADVIGAPITDCGVGVGVVVGAVGAVRRGAADFDWAMAGALAMTKIELTKMHALHVRIADIKSS